MAITGSWPATAGSRICALIRLLTSATIASQLSFGLHPDYANAQTPEVSTASEREQMGREWEELYAEAGEAARAGATQEAFRLLHASVDAGFVSEDLLQFDIRQDGPLQAIANAPEWDALIARIRTVRAESRRRKEAAYYGLDRNGSLEVYAQLQSDETDANALYQSINGWSQYPRPELMDREYLYFIDTEKYGQVPFLVFVPASYDASSPHPLVVYLHGGESRYVHSVAEGAFNGRSLLFAEAKRRGYLVLTPISDRTKGFGWAVRGDQVLPIIERQVHRVKQIYNVDDRRVYAIGHSDGGRGAFGFATRLPSLFAGFLAFNGAPSIILGDNYLRNLTSRPSYWVHTDGDETNTIQEVSAAAAVAQGAGADLTLKVYRGFGHEGEHIALGLPSAFDYLSGLVRNPFPSQINWEASSPALGRRDWIAITALDTTQVPAAWHTDLNFESYNKRDRVYTGEPFYRNRASGAVLANYRDNNFDITTSRVAAIDVYISPVMVNLADPVVVTVNNKVLFRGHVTPDPRMMIGTFTEEVDRQAIWMAVLHIQASP